GAVRLHEHVLRGDGPAEDRAVAAGRRATGRLEKILSRHDVTRQERARAAALEDLGIAHERVVTERLDLAAARALLDVHGRVARAEQEVPVDLGARPVPTRDVDRDPAGTAGPDGVEDDHAAPGRSGAQ